MNSQSSITQTVWIARYHPTALVASTILSVGVVVGLYLVFAHTMMHQYAITPLIAWHWCLPALTVLLLINIKMNIEPGKLTYAWRLGAINLHKPRHLSNGELVWHNIGNKNKTYRLGYNSVSAGYLPIVTLNRKGATMLSLMFR